MKKTLLASITLLLISGHYPARAQNYRGNNSSVLQLQIHCTLLGGLLRNNDQQELTRSYAERFARQLESTNDTKYAIEEKPALFVYGLTLEPRVFFGFAGLGINGYAIDAQTNKSVIFTRTGNGRVEIHSYMYSAGICPTLYFRPYFNDYAYIVFGFGAGGFRNTLELGIKDDTKMLGNPDPLDGYFIHEFIAEGTCYRGLIEFGYTPPDSVFFYNIGAIYHYTEPVEYRNRFSETLLLADNSTVYMGSMTSISLYCGFGVCF